MKPKLTLEIIKVTLPVLRTRLKQNRWPPMSYMLIPSILETADRYISYLAEVETEEAKMIREEIIFLREGFGRTPNRK